MQFHSKGDPVLYLGNPKGVNNEEPTRVDRHTVNALNSHRNETLNDPEISAKISQYEMAFRMQASVPS